MKNLKKQDIKDVMNDLFEEIDPITSKEVKGELRANGFWATQAVVGIAMREIADEDGLDWTFNGTFRLYFSKSNTLMSPTSTCTVTSQPPKKRVPADPQDRQPISGPDSGDWECDIVRSRGSPHQIYFIGSLTAPQARYAYALATGTDYVNVRSHRV